MHFLESAGEQFGKVPWGQLSLAVWLLVALALLFDFLNGFHDSANSIATVVSTRVLTPRAAVIWAAFFNFIAAFLLGTAVANTIGRGMIRLEDVTQYVVIAALLGAIIWDLLTWWWGLPTSSSHALIGGYAGAAMARAHERLREQWGQPGKLRLAMDLHVIAARKPA